MFRKFWDSYKNNFKKEILVHILIIIGLIGIVCIALSSCFEQKPEISQEPEVTETSEQEAYREALQNQLSVMLSQIAGVGRAEVLVTLEGSKTCHYAQDADSRYVTVGGSQKEALIESVSLPAVTGVIVACEGGSQSTVQETVYQTVSVACGLRFSQIYVTALEQK
ncbi:MAG: hypothetical protein IJ642_03130 [Oscillospiraceae bacterium]|nr:hypothetical protein [Oscillospiraceae bacterium]